QAGPYRILSDRHYVGSILIEEVGIRALLNAAELCCWPILDLNRNEAIVVDSCEIKFRVAPRCAEFDLLLERWIPLCVEDIPSCVNAIAPLGDRSTPSTSVVYHILPATHREGVQAADSQIVHRGRGMHSLHPHYTGDAAVERQHALAHLEIARSYP